MRAALIYLVGVVLLGVNFAWLVHGLLPFPYERVLSRSILLFAAIGLIPLWRHLDLSIDKIGLRPFDKSVLMPAYLVGVGIMLPVLLFFSIVGFRVGNTEVDFAGFDWWRFVVVAFTSAWLVGVFEEALFRGVFFSKLRNRYSFAVAAGVSSLVYAGVHFLRGPDDLVIDNVTWYTGYMMVGAAFSGVGDLPSIWDSALSLFLLGLVFCVVRQRYGLWACIALHSAWVFTLRAFKEVTVRDIVNPYASWTGSYDHFTGNLVTAWLLFILVLMALSERHNRNRVVG